MFTQNIKRNKNKTMSNANILQDHETHDPNYLEALSADQAPEGADQVGHLVGTIIVLKAKTPIIASNEAPASTRRALYDTDDIFCIFMFILVLNTSSLLYFPILVK